MAQRFDPQQALQKIRVDPPAKFTGKEDYERFYKRLGNYMSLTSKHYKRIFDGTLERLREPITQRDYNNMDRNIQLEPGTTEAMSEHLYYYMDSLLDGPPYMILDGCRT